MLLLHHRRLQGRQYIPDEHKGDLLREELTVMEWTGRADERVQLAGVTTRPVFDQLSDMNHVSR